MQVEKDYHFWSGVNADLHVIGRDVLEGLAVLPSLNTEAKVRSQSGSEEGSYVRPIDVCITQL